MNNGAIPTNISGGTTSSSTSTTSTNLEDIQSILARRTYDENGSFKLNGLELADRQESDSNGIAVSVADGKAYVNGYEVTKIASTKLYIDFEDSTFDVYNEPKTQVAGVYTYKLNRTPVKELLEVSSTVRRTEDVTRGEVHGGADDLTFTPVADIISISDSKNTYIYGTDFILKDDQVDWSPSGTGAKEPESGATYTVVYNYNRSQVIGTDVELINEFNEDDNAYESKIRFLVPENYPVEGTRTNINYSYYLARADLIVLNQKGEFEILKGTPTTLTKVFPPINKDNTRMELGNVIVLPGYTGADADSYLKRIILVNSGLVRLSQQKLFNMKERLDNLEYNQAMTDLDEEAISGETATQLRGIYTDGFIGFTKADTSYRGYDCGIDVDNGELSLASQSYTYTLNPDLTTSAIRTIGSSFIAPYTEEVVLSQNQATQAFKVNPYAAYDPMALLEVIPAIDNWIDEETVYIQSASAQAAATTLRKWWLNKNASWAASEKQKWIALTGTTGEQIGYATNYYLSYSYSTSTSFYDSLITYMRQIEVNVLGSNYRANADSLVCYFNETPVNLTPLSGTSAGTSVTINGKSYTTVKANADGEFSAKFTIPANTPCGVVNVNVRNAMDLGGTTTFTAQGHKQTKQITSQATARIVYYSVDPLAQSFQFSEDTLLTKVGLFFAVKDPSKNLVLQIRNIVNGFPGSEVYDEVIVKASDVKVSTTGATETVISLNRPVYCRANTPYCFAVLSDSDSYEMWIATIGDKNITNNSTVVSQPYGAGLMFSSSNSQTWTEHQTSDVKFKLYRAKFTGKGTVNFGKLTTSAVSRLLVAAQSEDFKNDGITWYYRTSSKSDWIPIETFDDHELDKLTTYVEVKAELSAVAGGTTSPILNNQAIDVIGFLNKTSGIYVSRAVFLDNTFNTVAVNLEAATPDKTSFKVYYSIDNTTWTQLTVQGTPKQVNEEYYRYSYKNTLDTPANKYRIKIEMATTDVTVRPKIRRLMSIMRNE